MIHEIVYELRIETISVQMILKVMDRTQAVVRESTNIAAEAEKKTYTLGYNFYFGLNLLLFM